MRLGNLPSQSMQYANAYVNACNNAQWLLPGSWQEYMLMRSLWTLRPIKAWLAKTSHIFKVYPYCTWHLLDSCLSPLSSQ